MSKTKMMIITMVMMSGVMFAVSADDLGQKLEKVEIRHSMLGYRDTLVFYSFKEQRAIMVLRINNKDDSFPVTGKAHLFDKTTTEEGLKKWINNQHSDALFGDAPKPLATKKLPTGFCKVTSRKQTGTSENPGPSKAMFKDFKVALSIKAQTIIGNFKLPAFTDTARVHVKSK
jgi:hypothetical protein